MQLDVYGVCILNSGDEICTSNVQGGGDETDIATRELVYG